MIEAEGVDDVVVVVVVVAAIGGTGGGDRTGERRVFGDTERIDAFSDAETASL